MTFSNGTAFPLPSGTSTNTTCPASIDTAMGTTPAVGLLNDVDTADCVPASDRDIEYNAANTFTLYSKGTGYAQATNVTGTSVSIRARSNSSASMTITPRLFYTAPTGTITYFTGSTAGKAVGTTRTTLSFSLTGQSATNIPAGSKLGIQFSMSTDSRICVNDSTGLIDELVVKETPVDLSSNANLSGLLLSAGSLTPSFSSSTISYTAAVANSVTSITVTPTQEDTTATTSVNGIAVNSGSASGPIALAEGNNTITTVVTAQNGTSRTYTVVVTRAPVTPVTANLSSLSLSSGALSPIFAGSTIYYTSSVSNSTSTITVTPTAEDSAATIKVNGIAVTSGTASIPFALIVGANGFNVTVTASDGLSTKNYTIVVTRQPVGSNNANLSGLGLSSGLLSPTFAATTVYYTATVSNVISTITVTPIAEEAAATIIINGIAVASGAASVPFALVVGTNSLHVLVTAPDGSTIKTYTIIVTREQTSNNANLGNMTLSSGLLDPAFNSSTTSYTAAVANAVSTITVTPTAESAYAGIRVNGITVTSGATSIPFTLAVGPNSLNVVVIAQDGTTTKSYSIVVTRANPPSTNANLSNLVLSSGTLSPTFSSSTANYSTAVANAVSTITVTPTVQDATATIKVNNIAVTSGTATVPFALAVGANNINVVVTAQDGTTIQTYTVVVTRAAAISTNPNLGNLTLSSGALTPTFSSSTTKYSATVANTVSSVTVTPTAQDGNATIKINGISVTSGAASVPFALAVGANSLYVVVTAQDGSTFKNYSIVITRESVKSTNANLGNLAISAGIINPAFSSTTANYSATVANAVSTITVTPTAQDASATIQVNGVTVASGSTSTPFALATGANSLQIVVTAQDGITSKILLDSGYSRSNRGQQHHPGSADFFRPSTGPAITVTAPFTGDTNGNNSCVIRWGTSLITIQIFWLTNKVGSAYVASISSGLTMGATYYFQATFTDPDGTSSNTVAGSQATTNTTAGNPLMHNGANLNSTYDNGTWGLTFTCNTCHAKTTTNIKKITTSIPATIGTELIKPVKFRSLTTMGNDGDHHTTSDRICEVCHTQTSVHRYNTSSSKRIQPYGDPQQ